MKRFILYILIFSTAVVLSVVFIFSFTDGYSDVYYLKFTSSKKTNLIIGTSKSAQGIQPNILQGVVGDKFYNYSFAINVSPFGKVYLNSIKDKLNTDDTSQIFIVTVDPWSISSLTDDPNDTLNFIENNSCLNHVSNVDQKINYSYLINYFDESYYKILKRKSPAFLHDDGWLEVTIDGDSLSVQRRTDFTIADYHKKVNQYKYSSIRYSYLLKTIEYLKKYGKVYLVRLPVHNDLFKIENQTMPDFNEKIKSAIDLSKGYLDMTSYNSKMLYTDGVHLNKASGEEASIYIANWIKGR